MAMSDSQRAKLADARADQRDRLTAALPKGGARTSKIVEIANTRGVRNNPSKN